MIPNTATVLDDQKREAGARGSSEEPFLLIELHLRTSTSLKDNTKAKGKGVGVPFFAFVFVRGDN